MFLDKHPMSERIDASTRIMFGVIKTADFLFCVGRNILQILAYLAVINVS